MVPFNQTQVLSLLRESLEWLQSSNAIKEALQVYFFKEQKLDSLGSILQHYLPLTIPSTFQPSEMFQENR